MKIYLASDHAGFDFKNHIKEFLTKKGYEVEDCGPFVFDKNDDYPDFISKAAEKVSKDSSSKGIVLGKSGAGECIVANKTKGVRAVLGFNSKNVSLSREHNDANVLSLGSEFVTDEEACSLAALFLDTPFSGDERHVRRIEKIKAIENC